MKAVKLRLSTLANRSFLLKKTC